MGSEKYEPSPGAAPRGTVDRVRTRLADRRTRPITAALLAAAVVLVGLLAYWIVLLVELPSTVDLERSRFEQATVVYAADGAELTSYQSKHRRWVALGEISPHVVDALIAAEDHRFYQHHGIDVVRTVGAVAKTLAGDTQGGSTITMQFARNAFADIYDDWMLTRKVKEWITALRIEAMYDKDEILEMYLNTVPFMYNAFGIEAAAQTYFQVPASSLNAKGAATLVGMLKGTVYYNPVRHPERSHERRNVVLQQMVEHGYLDPAEYEEIRDVPTRLDFERISRAEEPAPHFAEYLRQWLDEWAERYGYNLYTDGLRVHTTIDSRLQAAAQQAVDQVGDALQAVADVEWSRSSVPYFSSSASAYQQYRQRVAAFDYFWRSNPELLDRFLRDTPRYRQMVGRGTGEAAALDSLRADAAFVDSVRSVRQRLQAGFVAIDPRDGQVRAWVGGRDFGIVQYDHVAQSKRQPGSTFKPFVYAAALERGFSPTDRLRDERVEYVDPDTRRRWRPSNVGSVSGQLMTLRDGLAYSKNTITAQLVLELGPRRVVDMAHQMGIRSELAAYPSIALGTSEVSLLELAGAYTPIARHGRYAAPVFVTRIESHDGRVLARFRSDERQVLSATTAYDLLDMMRGVVDYGTGVRIRNQYGARGDLAGKTGTTQNGADGWFMLMHPHLIMGAWVGFDVPAISFRSDYWGQGSHNALHVVGTVYRAARRSNAGLLADVSFAPPPGYRPPRPALDTTYYGGYGGFDYAAYLDSLNAVSDSLLQRYDDYDFAYDDSSRWRSIDEMEREEEREAFAQFEDLDADSLDLTPLEERTTDDARSAGDSLRLPGRTGPPRERDRREPPTEPPPADAGNAGREEPPADAPPQEDAGAGEAAPQPTDEEQGTGDAPAPPPASERDAPSEETAGEALPPAELPEPARPPDTTGSSSGQ